MLQSSPSRASARRRSCARPRRGASRARPRPRAATEAPPTASSAAHGAAAARRRVVAACERGARRLRRRAFPDVHHESRRRGRARAGRAPQRAARRECDGLCLRASTTSAAAHASAGSVTAGICQSQSRSACTSHATYAASAVEASGPDARAAPPRAVPRARAAGAEPDRAELGERLEVEVVGVARGVRDRALLQPPALVAPGARAEERLALDHPPGDAPVVAAPVPGDAEDRRLRSPALAGGGASTRARRWSTSRIGPAASATPDERERNETGRGRNEPRKARSLAARDERDAGAAAASRTSSTASR